MGISGSGIAGPYIGKGVSLPFGVGLDSIVDYSQPIRDSNFIKDGVLDSTITHSGGANETLFDADGNLVYPPHNLLLQSEDFGTTWVNNSSTDTSNVATDPNGGSTADQVSITAQFGGMRQNIAVVSGTTYTISVYIQSVSGNTALHLYNITQSTGGSITATAEWQRVSFTWTADATETQTLSVPQDRNAGGRPTVINLWGAQINQGSSVSTYVPTTTAAVWAARFGYFYTGSIWVPKGVGPIELEGINYIRNNTMVGASAGTPGTNPDNWTATSGGLTRTIVGTGVVNGIAFIDYRWFGTPSGNFELRFESSTGIDAVATDVRTVSSYFAITGGDISNISTIAFNLREMNEAGGGVKSNIGSDIKGSLTASLQRFTYTVTLSGGTTAHVLPQLGINWDGSGDIDLTLRIGIPKEAKEPFVTSDILTTSAAVTRDAETYTRTVQHRDEFTILLKGRTAAGSGEQVFFQVDDGDENERARIVRNASNEMRWIVTDGGVDQCNLNLGTVADDTDFAVAVRAKASDFAGSLDGAAVVTDTGGTMPSSGLTNERFGHDSAGNQCGGHIARVVDWDEPHPDNVLQNLPL